MVSVSFIVLSPVRRRVQAKPTGPSRRVTSPHGCQQGEPRTSSCTPLSGGSQIGVSPELVAHPNHLLKMACQRWCQPSRRAPASFGTRDYPVRTWGRTADTLGVLDGWLGAKETARRTGSPMVRDGPL